MIKDSTNSVKILNISTPNVSTKTANQLWDHLLLYFDFMTLLILNYISIQIYSAQATVIAMHSMLNHWIVVAPKTVLRYVKKYSFFDIFSRDDFTIRKVLCDSHHFNFFCRENIFEFTRNESENLNWIRVDFSKVYNENLPFTPLSVRPFNYIIRMYQLTSNWSTANSNRIVIWINFVWHFFNRNLWNHSSNCSVIMKLKKNWPNSKSSAPDTMSSFRSVTILQVQSKRFVSILALFSIFPTSIWTCFISIFKLCFFFRSQKVCIDAAHGEISRALTQLFERLVVVVSVLSKVSNFIISNFNHLKISLGWTLHSD